MSAHPDTFAALSRMLSATTNPEVIDQILDRWNEYRNLATAWDARHWGFNPDKWMLKERTEMDRRATLSNYFFKQANNH